MALVFCPTIKVNPEVYDTVHDSHVERFTTLAFYSMSVTISPLPETIKHLCSSQEKPHSTSYPRLAE
jgi:hypothetical protein